MRGKPNTSAKHGINDVFVYIYTTYRDVLFKKWKEKMNQICQKNNATKSKEAEERKKGLLEHVWEGLAAPKLSGHTYVKWNDSIERLPGKDNRTDEWALNADPASTLSSYKFLCPICVMRI